ncbi:ABC transporter substrate-binding protein [Rhodophyticola sp.]|jgi:NitT/TauT family transport system substrate-binding protein|uniref:ABC transporter substrate-binding protein n=1 Tax=Rhodophyticola sp. TaxID=2680032 RepID=UPI001B0AFC68|nr:ABC transporter substrate-binding protein [Roseicyclus sp.]MBO6626192.1 ABC transporter substrate-binding protein [Roseicyclus sp.]MBO6922333.1 ABC transporter substrate-binding protein [Roseicyclus sp.]
MSHPINRRSFLQTTGAAAGLAASGTMMSVLPAGAGGHAYTIRMQLGWLASNGIMGEVMADHLGYFEEEGLALEIIPGGPNIDGVPSVASGVNNFGSISSSPSLMLARSAGLPVKCIAAGYQRHPFTYFSLAGNPVRTPQDLIGKTVATQGTARILLRALLAHNGIAEEDVEVSVMGADMNALMTGQVDVVTGWTTNVNALSILGDQRVDLALWDGGIQLYANPYYTTDDMLAEHGDKMQAAIRAISRGWGAAHDDPEAAVEALVARYPNLDRDSEMLAAPLVLDFSFNAQTAAGGWGVMTEENWQAQIDIYDQLDQFANGAPALDDVMTLEILDATADTRPTHG